MLDPYDVARHVTDDVMGEGTYAIIHAGNPDPGVQDAISRYRSRARYRDVLLIMAYDRDMINDMLSVLSPSDMDGFAIDGDALTVAKSGSW